MSDQWTRQQLAFDGPLPGYTPKYHPTYYLSDEASRKRMDALVERISRHGLRPGESVPAHIMDRARREAEQEAAA